jgi:hypothetical protein
MSDPLRNSISMNPNKRMQEISTFTQQREILYTNSQGYASTIIITTSAQIASLVPKIMDTTSYAQQMFATIRI